MKLSADLVPHSEFHSRVWFQSVERPSWYYFKKKQSRNIITNKNFISSLDKPLKELVKFLHKKGIKTTPSCSGHHLGGRNLEKIYEDLEEDSAAIRSGGLWLKDIETGRLFFFKDETYTLPWNKKTFLERLSEYQQKGVLGLRLGHRKKIGEQLLKLQVKHVRVEEKDGILFIFTNENKESDINATWKMITRQVKKILE